MVDSPTSIFDVEDRKLTLLLNRSSLVYSWCLSQHFNELSFFLSHDFVFSFNFWLLSMFVFSFTFVFSFNFWFIVFSRARGVCFRFTYSTSIDSLSLDFGFETLNNGTRLLMWLKVFFSPCSFFVFLSIKFLICIYVFDVMSHWLHLLTGTNYFVKLSSWYSLSELWKSKIWTPK